MTKPRLCGHRVRATDDNTDWSALCSGQAQYSTIWAGRKRRDAYMVSVIGREQDNSPRACLLVVAGLFGGVGKTTTAYNLAYILAKRGKRVLLVGFDPQGDLSLRMRLKPRIPSLSRVMSKNLKIAPNPTPVCWGETTVDVLPATVKNMAPLELNLLNTVVGREGKLHEALKEHSLNYDYILVDSAPAASLMNINAYIAASLSNRGGLILTVQCEDKAFNTLPAMFQSLSLLSSLPLCITAIVPTLLDRRLPASEEVEQAIRKQYAGFVTEATIPRRGKVSEDARWRAPVAHYEPRNDASVAYGKLADEIIVRTTSPEYHQRLTRATRSLLEKFPPAQEDFDEVEEEGVMQLG